MIVMATETEAPERIWLPLKDAPYVPNAEFYVDKEHDDDIEYVRADAAPRELKWTKEFPTVDGVYWSRLKGDSDHIPVRLEGGALFEFGVMKVFGRREYDGCEFLGPITPQCAAPREQELKEVLEGLKQRVLSDGPCFCSGFSERDFPLAYFENRGAAVGRDNGFRHSSECRAARAVLATEEVK